MDLTSFDLQVIGTLSIDTLIIGLLVDRIVLLHTKKMHLLRIIDDNTC